MELLSNSRIIEIATSYAIKNNVYLTSLNYGFFCFLVSLFKDTSSYDSTYNLYSLQVSQKEFSEMFGISYNACGIYLKKLEKCGLISRFTVSKDFCPLPDGKFLKNKPFITCLDLSLFLA